MKLIERKKAFIILGKHLKNLTLDEIFLEKVFFKNRWFIKKFVKSSLKNIANILNEENINKFLEPYIHMEKNKISKTAALVLAGNIPMVGFHDLFTVLISGNKVNLKLSSKDDILIKKVIDILIEIQPGFKNYIKIENSHLKNFDGIIATGSNNTARYFESYFRKYKNIIRKNRISFAILNGMESAEEIQNLGKDIFTYFGLGCRNVSKIFIPRNFNFSFLLENFKNFEFVKNHNKYKNNYDYNKAIFLLNNISHFDNGFVLLKEDKSFFSPISTIFYEFYDNLEKLEFNLQFKKEAIQCVVGSSLKLKNVNFGETQKPNLWDFADNIDTLEWNYKL